MKTEPAVVGASAAIQDILEEVNRASGSDARVLISGETVIPAEIIARRIHDQSARRLGPFVAVTCAEMRIAQEVDDWLDRADGGTLFIDEICSMDVAQQEALSTILESRRIRKRGAPRTEEGADVRIIAASGRDLHREVSHGHFSETLFYRLNLIHIILRNRSLAGPFVPESPRM